MKGLVKALSAKELTGISGTWQSSGQGSRLQKQVRRASKASKSVRPANEVRHIVQEMLHRRPFQSWQELEYTFESDWDQGLASQIQKAKSLGSIQPVKTQLGLIAKRRNQIVHERRSCQHRRGERPKRHQVSRKFADDTLSFIRDLVSQLEAVA